MPVGGAGLPLERRRWRSRKAVVRHVEEAGVPPGPWGAVGRLQQETYVTCPVSRTDPFGDWQRMEWRR